MLCIIPARGGSKRIERKNIKDFDGQPIIAYSIRAALASGLFSEVMVSTDDAEIAATAQRYGASVPFMRSEATAGDFATTADVIGEVLTRYDERGRNFRAFCCLYATAPFVTQDTLRRGARLVTEGGADSAFTCVRYSYPVQRSLEIDSTGRIAMVDPGYATARSQDLAPRYHDAGQLYFSTVEAFRRIGSLWGDNTRPIILDETMVQDLDTPTDWKIAEIKYRMIFPPGRMRVGDYELIPYPDLEREDSLAMLAGRNMPGIRTRMVDTAEIKADDHLAFVRKLPGNGRRGYYAVRDRSVGSLFDPIIGTVTLERQDDPAEMERGIWLFPNAQGKGHAGRLLAGLYRTLHDAYGVDRMLTKVRVDNTASLALERHLGAIQTDTEDGYHKFVTKL